MKRGNQTKLLAAFTLIEILIAITVLAIGLLGLGAIFPVVIREQRIAIQQMEAPAATDHVSAVLRTHGILNTPEPGLDPDVDMNFGVTRWERLFDPAGGAMFGGLSAADQLIVPDSGATHQPPVVGVPNWLLNMDSGNERKGDLVFSWGGAPVRIPLAQRLLPTPGEADGVRPEFIWDMALFRPENGTLKAIVFVRPLDVNIRVPTRFRDGDTSLGSISLTDVLLERYDVMENERKLPISVQLRTGRPTGDGDFGGDYAPILSVQVDQAETQTLSEDRPQYDTLVLETDPSSYPDNAKTLLGRVGQLIAVQRTVNEVTVHRVTQVVTQDGLDPEDIAVRVTPSLQPTQIAGGVPRFEYEAVLYSPVPPVDVRVVDLGVSP